MCVGVGCVVGGVWWLGCYEFVLCVVVLWVVVLWVGVGFFLVFFVMVLVFFVVDLVVFFVVVVFGFFFLNLKLILLFGCFMRNVLKLWLVCDDLKFGSRFVWLLVSSLFICLCVIFCCRIILFEWKL